MTDILVETAFKQNLNLLPKAGNYNIIAGC